MTRLLLSVYRRNFRFLFQNFVTCICNWTVTLQLNVIVYGCIAKSIVRKYLIPLFQKLISIELFLLYENSPIQFPWHHFSVYFVAFKFQILRDRKEGVLTSFSWAWTTKAGNWNIRAKTNIVTLPNLFSLNWLYFLKEEEPEDE